MCGWCCGGTPVERRGEGHKGCSATCYNATPPPRAERVPIEGDENAAANAALLAAAEDIERELICCDAFEQGDSTHRHQICYWSGAARALVLARVTSPTSTKEDA